MSRKNLVRLDRLVSNLGYSTRSRVQVFLVSFISRVDRGSEEVTARVVQITSQSGRRDRVEDTIGRSTAGDDRGRTSKVDTTVSLSFSH